MKVKRREILPSRKKLQTKKRIAPTPVPKFSSLERIISGGQIGVDKVALEAAYEFKPFLLTGGHMPEGFVTLEGVKPEYEQKYGCIDDTPGIAVLNKFGNIVTYRPDFGKRTWRNVEEADATIRIATNFYSRGERCTLNAIKYYHKPHLDIWIGSPVWYSANNQEEFALTPRQVAKWILSNNIRVLNIAGNANVDLEEKVYDFLMEVFNIIVYGV